MCCRVTSLTHWATLPPSCHLNGDRLSEQERALRSPTAWPLGLRDKSSDLSWLQPLCGVRIFLTGILGVSGKEWLQSGGHFPLSWIQTPLIHTWGCLEGSFLGTIRVCHQFWGFLAFRGSAVSISSAGPPAVGLLQHSVKEPHLVWKESIHASSLGTPRCVQSACLAPLFPFTGGQSHGLIQSVSGRCCPASLRTGDCAHCERVCHQRSGPVLRQNLFTQRFSEF